MGIFGFLKKKSRVEVEADEVEKLRFTEIDKFLKKREKETVEYERDFFSEFGPKIDFFLKNIEPKLNVLEEIDVESKKEHEKAKILVRQGLDKYVNAVRVLMKEIDSLERENLGEFIKDFSLKFTNFEKGSFKFYERATYLIGDEMAEVRNYIRKFYNECLKDFKDNENLLKKISGIESAMNKLNKFDEAFSVREKLHEEIEKNEKKVEKDKKIVDKISKEIEDIKASREYTWNLKVEEEVKKLRSDLNNEVMRFKNLIDFKRLSTIVHANRKELELVKSYKDHFSAEFSKDGGKGIVHLLEDNGMKNDDMDRQLLVIEEKRNSLDEKRKCVGVDPTTVKWNEIRRLEDEIEKLQNDNVRQSRRLDEMDLKVKGLRSEVVELVEKMGVEVD